MKPAQEVKRILECDKTWTYRILLGYTPSDDMIPYLNSTLKTSYGKKMTMLHPDNNPHPQSTVSFQCLQAAYEGVCSRTEETHKRELSLERWKIREHEYRFKTSVADTRKKTWKQEIKEAVRKAVKRLVAEKKAARKEAARNEVERKEAERKEAERKEAERKEVERKEVDRKEMKRKEMKRKEMKRKEGARKTKRPSKRRRKLVSDDMADSDDYSVHDTETESD